MKNLNICFQVRPHLELTFQNILSHINTIYVLKTRAGVMQVNEPPEYRYLRLKGQMLHIPEADLIVFLCYPSVMNLDDLTRFNFFLSSANFIFIYLLEKFFQFILLGEVFI